MEKLVSRRFTPQTSLGDRERLGLDIRIRVSPSAQIIFKVIGQDEVNEGMNASIEEKSFKDRAWGWV